MKNYNYEDKINIIKNGYSIPLVLEDYYNSKFWKSEELLIDEYFGKGSDVLDIGCGAGRTSVGMYKMGLKVKGIDLTFKMIEYAEYKAKKENCDIDFVVMDVTNLKFPNESFDNVLFSFNGIEHVPLNKKLIALKEIYRILKNSGYFILTVHSCLPCNKDGKFWFYDLYYYILGKLFPKKYPVRTFGERYIMYKDKIEQYFSRINIFNFKKLLKKSGFKIIYYNDIKRVEEFYDTSFWSNFKSGNIFLVCKKV